MKRLSSTHNARGALHRMAAANSEACRIKLVGLGSGGTAVVGSIDIASL